MKEFTKEQNEFLKRHNILKEEVFDATRYTKKEYHILMKQQGKIVAFNVFPCAKEGHTIRNRHGHCLQCDTAKIAFVKRGSKRGFVYIAGSIKGQVIKVGFTDSVIMREKSLNRDSYASFNDWELLYAGSALNAGKIEIQLKKELSRYNHSLNKYEHDDHLQKAIETLKCSYLKAKETLIEICKDKEFVITSNKNGSDYNFRNLLRS